MQMKTHPLERTAIDLRRMIIRTEAYIRWEEDPEKVKAALEVLSCLKEARAKLPPEFAEIAYS